MRRAVVIVLGVLVVAAPVTAATSIGVLPMPSTDDQQFSALSTAQSNTSDMPPGARFVGVIDAHEHRQEGSVGKWRVQVRIESGATAAEQAAILERIYQETRQQLNRLEGRLRGLGEALSNDSITRREYRVRRASLTVELRTVERIAAYMEAKGADLGIGVIPGISVSIEDLQALEARATALQGSILGEIAPSFTIASGTGGGDSVTDGGDDGTSDPIGESTNVTAALTDAESKVATARERVEEAETTLDGLVIADDTAALLNQAQYNLSVAEQRLAAAREAQAAGDDERAAALAEEAIYHAGLAIDHAEAAIDAATST